MWSVGLTEGSDSANGSPRSSTCRTPRALPGETKSDTPRSGAAASGLRAQDKTVPTIPVVAAPSQDDTLPGFRSALLLWRFEEASSSPDPCHPQRNVASLVQTR